jgi:uncharacterized protein YdeI (YjbR/CyaY-like superfamily)
VKARYFKSAREFGDWLEAYHATAAELLVGFYKKGSGRPTLTWPESVDEALCYGWIDGIRRRVDDERYTIRFTPRRAGSCWSAVNTKRAQELAAAGRMRPAGLAAFEQRDSEKTKQYLYERDHAELMPSHLKQFRANRSAWAFFQAQPAGYRRLCTQFVIAAKQEATRQRRLDTLIDHSAKGRKFRWM